MMKFLLIILLTLPLSGKKAQTAIDEIGGKATTAMITEHFTIAKLGETKEARVKVQSIIRQWFAYWYEVNILKYNKSDSYERAIKSVFIESKVDHPWLYKLYIQCCEAPLNVTVDKITIKKEWKINNNKEYEALKLNFKKFIDEKVRLADAALNLKP